MKTRNQKGFSLVEMLVIVMTFGLISGILIVYSRTADYAHNYADPKPLFPEFKFIHRVFANMANLF